MAHECIWNRKGQGLPLLHTFTYIFCYRFFFRLIPTELRSACHSSNRSFNSTPQTSPRRQSRENHDETHMLRLRLRPEPRLPGERPPPPHRLNRAAPTTIIPAVDARLAVRAIAPCTLRRRRRRAMQSPSPPLRGAGTCPRVIAADGSGISSGAARSSGRLAHGVEGSGREENRHRGDPRRRGALDAERRRRPRLDAGCRGGSGGGDGGGGSRVRERARRPGSSANANANANANAYTVAAGAADRGTACSLAVLLGVPQVHLAVRWCGWRAGEGAEPNRTRWQQTAAWSEGSEEHPAGTKCCISARAPSLKGGGGFHGSCGACSVGMS